MRPEGQEYQQIPEFHPGLIPKQDKESKQSTESADSKNKKLAQKRIEKLHVLLNEEEGVRMISKQNQLPYDEFREEYIRDVLQGYLGYEHVVGTENKNFDASVIDRLEEKFKKIVNRDTPPRPSYTDIRDQYHQ